MDILRVNEKHIIDSMQPLIQIARENWKAVSIGAQDATRADLFFLKKFISTALCAGAQRIRIADTVGILSPLKTKMLFENLLESAPGEVLEFRALMILEWLPPIHHSSGGPGLVSICNSKWNPRTGRNASS
jgi:homocitrate synthase NifV